MSEYALDNQTKEVCSSSATERGANMHNIITLSSHPLWKARELERLVEFLRDGKPDSYWRSILYERGEQHGERAIAWTTEMIMSGSFSGERILDMAKTLAPMVYTLEYIENRRKNPPPFDIAAILGKR